MADDMDSLKIRTKSAHRHIGKDGITEKEYVIVWGGIQLAL